jgi:hypothetical protein
VNVSTIAELMGHQKQTLALAVYSSGLVAQQLRAASLIASRDRLPGSTLAPTRGTPNA